MAQKGQHSKRMQEEKQNESTWFPVQSFSRSWYFETAVVVIPTTWTIYNHLDSPMSQVASDCMWKFTGNFEIGIRRLHLPENCKFSVPVQGLKWLPPLPLSCESTEGTCEGEVCNMQMLCMHQKRICTQGAYLHTSKKMHWGTVLHVLRKHIVRKYEDTMNMR